MLENECCKKNAGEDERHNGCRTLPSIEGASKVDAHDQADKTSNAEDCTRCINLCESGEYGSPRLWPVAWNEEEIDWTQQADQAEVDVEAPSPCCARISKCAADERTDDISDTEDKATVRVRNLC